MLWVHVVLFVLLRILGEVLLAGVIWGFFRKDVRSLCKMSAVFKCTFPFEFQEMRISPHGFHTQIGAFNLLWTLYHSILYYTKLY